MSMYIQHNSCSLNNYSTISKIKNSKFIVIALSDDMDIRTLISDCFQFQADQFVKTLGYNMNLGVFFRTDLFYLLYMYIILKASPYNTN